MLMIVLDETEKTEVPLETVKFVPGPPAFVELAKKYVMYLGVPEGADEGAKDRDGFELGAGLAEGDMLMLGDQVLTGSGRFKTTIPF
jgi:hypothetical protein